ncbi:hypothetical protein CC86DRAFT_444450 [Ophiobolus disseminans]|uniref:DNA polymerase delta subunit 3 n=1 Tax=Ophiobolus disseminans TaxID=1469910 RepID=A0A6A7A7V4_9PLEO|nr:hypothetical protein CC86DRAFT_444450 [Ophiobolus disseminans]
MAEERSRDYLAARVLTEGQPVTYRLLSRAIKVDVNTAKWMLFDFHKQQNAKKSNTVHATYLITGKKRSEDDESKHTNGVNGRDGDDTNMRSSPFMSSMPEPEEDSDESDEEPVKQTTILLVREEQLQETRAEFDEESSIHIYSLEPGPIENLSILATCNYEVATGYADEDPMERWKTYGSIHNPHIKRRTRKFGPPPAASTSKAAAKPATKPAAKPSAATQSKAKETAAPARRGSASEDNASGRSTPRSSAGTSTLKRADSKSGAKKSQTAGDLFKSFAKSKPKAKDADRSQESTPAPVEDEPMQGMSEDEGDVEDEPDVKVDEEKKEAARQARDARQEKLRKMMEDDDEDMPDAPTDGESQPEPTPAASADISEPAETETVTVENGRRRGRRRVMKKKKVKDEDGYLVTKEEAVWESFSEDEPQPKRLKPAPTKAASSAKGKPAGKKGQGSIASFFKKA